MEKIKIKRRGVPDMSMIFTSCASNPFFSFSSMTPSRSFDGSSPQGVFEFGGSVEKRARFEFKIGLAAIGLRRQLLGRPNTCSLACLA